MNLGLGTIVNTYSYREKDGVEQVKAHVNNSEPQLVVVVFTNRKIIHSWIVFS
jgi:hypothetical protein